MKVERLQPLWFLDLAKGIGKPRKKEPFMDNVLREMRRRKRKSRRLGELEVVEGQAYEALGLDAKVELILELIPLGVQ